MPTMTTNSIVATIPDAKKWLRIPKQDNPGSTCADTSVCSSPQKWLPWQPIQRLVSTALTSLRRWQIKQAWTRDNYLAPACLSKSNTWQCRSLWLRSLRPATAASDCIRVWLEASGQRVSSSKCVFMQSAVERVALRRAMLTCSRLKHSKPWVIRFIACGRAGEEQLIHKYQSIIIMILWNW